MVAGGDDPPFVVFERDQRATLELVAYEPFQLVYGPVWMLRIAGAHRRSAPDTEPSAEDAATHCDADARVPEQGLIGHAKRLGSCDPLTHRYASFVRVSAPACH